MAAAHRAFGDTLLPLAHPDAFFQGGAFLQQEVPTAVRVSGPDAGSAGRRQGHFFKKTAAPALGRLLTASIAEIKTEAKTCRKSGDGCVGRYKGCKKYETGAIRSAGKLWRMRGEKLWVENEVKRENMQCIFATLDVDLSCSFSHSAYQP